MAPLAFVGDADGPSQQAPAAHIIVATTWIPYSTSLHIDAMTGMRLNACVWSTKERGQRHYTIIGPFS